jgi:O-antigen ligase
MILAWESVILGFFYRLYSTLESYYSYSFFARTVRALGSCLNKLLDASAIVKFIRREGFFSRTLGHSAIYNLLDKVFNFPARVSRRFYEGRKAIFGESYAFRLLSLFTRNFHMLLALTLVVLLAVPDAKWSNAYGTIMVLGFFVLFFLKSATEKADFNIKSMDFYLLLFMLAVVLSQVFSIFPGLSLRFMVFYINCFLFVLLIVSSVRTSEQLGQFIETVLVGITLTGLYGIWQAIAGVPVNPSQIDVNLNEGMPGRIFSTIGNSNSYAEVLVMFLPFYAAVILNSKSIFKKLAFAALAVPPFLSLLLTFSRSSWIGSAIAVLVFVFFWNRKLIPLLIAAGLLCIPVLPQSIYRRILTIFNPNDTSAGYRVLIYKTIWPVLKDYWFTGIGLGTDAFMKVVQNYALYTKGAIPPHSHNVFAQVWLETGIVGILSYAGFLLGLLKRGIKNIAGKTDVYTRNFIVAGISALIGISVVSVAEYVWFYHRVMILFWVVAALVMASLNISRESSKESSLS